MVERFLVTLPPLTGGDKRTAYVYLPRGYGGETRYPVMYMFDGHNLFTDREATFGKCWGMEEFLDDNSVPLIVAAVECNHSGNSRLSEYSPVSFNFRGERIIGRGKKYMDWLTGVFKSHIDGNYSTLPDRAHTYIAGSSMGGLMTMYALAKYNKYFCGGAALSPSLWVGGGEIPSFIESGRYGKDTVLYTDYGSKEFINHALQKRLFCNAYSALVEKGVNVTARVVPDGFHSEASWEKCIPVFLRVLGLV